MKLDIVQAWKDQTYRQNLNDEQIAIVPANPAGELAETDLVSVCGGGGAPLGIASASASRTVFEDIRIHSFSATTCDVNIFSAAQIATLSPLNILSTLAQLCANND